MARYKIYKTTYSFEKPLLLKEEEYIQMRKGLPIYPQPDDINKMLLKEYWWYIIALFPPLFVFMVLIPLLHGAFEPLEKANAMKEKNKFFAVYYDSIYNSKNYEDYCKKNKNLQTTRKDTNRIFGY
jgi:hypothetical protein